MEHPEPDSPYILPPNLRRRALNIFQRALPRPLTDDPEDTEERDAEAIDDITSLRPVNNEEVLLAVQFVVANAQAHDVLGVIPIDGRDDLRQLAQAANMMRQSRGARLLLMRVQAERRKLEQSVDAAARTSTAPNAEARGQTAARSVTFSETESHSAGNETLVRPASPVPATTGMAQILPSATSASDPETIPGLSGNETTVRRGSATPATTVAPDSLSPEPSVSSFETSSRISVIETPMRHFSPAPATTIAPDRWPGPPSASDPSTQKSAVERT